METSWTETEAVSWILLIPKSYYPYSFIHSHTFDKSVTQRLWDIKTNVPNKLFK